MFRFFVLIGFCGMLFLGCNDIIDSENNKLVTPITYKEVKEDQKNGVLCPLNIGNLWVYHIYLVNDSGNKQLMGADTITIGKEININNEIWYEYISSNNGTDSEEPFMIAANTDVGLWCIIGGSEEIGENYLEAKFPVQDGDTYYSNINERVIYTSSDNKSLSSDISVTRKDSVKLDEPVVTNKGTY